jgi:hypothetical protein
MYQAMMVSTMEQVSSTPGMTVLLKPLSKSVFLIAGRKSDCQIEVNGKYIFCLLKTGWCNAFLAASVSWNTG